MAARVSPLAVRSRCELPVVCEHDWTETDDGLQCDKCGLKMRDLKREAKHRAAGKSPALDSGPIISSKRG
jgi:hypothetical protein